ncbi:hatching enzyme 1.2-like [Acipenser ruthenus]|uniref:hatching enzyme 1.2-like n=1 Tax=Acipenser ruthenus TaxID=7906 RepID=UPI0027418C02|nr:hatching enzyme 1.2-like [Acipenser ruthenus]
MKMDHKLVLATLALLLSVSHGKPLKGDHSGKGQRERRSPGIPEDKDVFSIILEANKGIKEHLMEGDIVVSNSRNAMNCPDNSCFWPKASDGFVYVPYTISSEYSAEEKDIISSAFPAFDVETCIKFKQRTTEKDYINISPQNGCWSNVGKYKGVQQVSLSKGGCVYKATAQHELIHALGFYHEQSRPDRDSYVRINWQYIPADQVSNFYKQDINTLGMPYDYTSIMHYGRDAFSNTTGKFTIVPIPDETVEIGQRIAMSPRDIQKINKLYGCNVCNTLLEETNGSFASQNYPNSYQSNSDCLFQVNHPNSKVLLEFDAFALQSSVGCVSDYIKVYDGSTKSSPVLLDRSCGNVVPPPLLASGSAVLLQFVSDSSITATGFKASYSTVQCGGILTAVSGTLTSSNYPLEYPVNTDCIWIINAPKGYKVSLTISSFDVEYSEDCSYDYLNLRDGPKTTSPVQQTHCGSEPIPSFTSSGNAAVVQFHSDGSDVGTGFSAKYKFVAV